MGMSVYRANSYTYQVTFSNNGIIGNEYVDFVQSRAEAISIIKEKYGTVRIISARRCNDSNVAVM